MGGSWASDVNDCWEACYGRETQVVNRLTEIVNNMGLDGVDLDFEYHITDKAVKFLNDVTTGLKNSLPVGSEITHAPMDSDIVPGKPYYDDVLKVTGSLLDFLMPQYYNGITRPVIDGIAGTGTGSMSALSHYNTIVDNIYGGDPTRMVFGFCISACGGTGSNADGQQALTVMNDLNVEHPCNGGAFFWVVENDQGASWSSLVSTGINSDGCSTTPTIPSPTSPSPLTIAPAPISVPSPSPVQEDDSRLIAYLGNWQSCPTTAEVYHYTHIIIAFAVSYTWSPSKNNCSPTCDIDEPPICNNSANPALVSAWQAAGKKVILSFGGEFFLSYALFLL